MRVLLDSFSKQERALFLDEHKKEQGNGFLLRQWIGHRPIHPRRHRSWHRQTADLQLFRPLVVSGFDLHNGRHPRQELPNHAHRHRATPITRKTVFSLTHPLSACTRKRAALHLSTAHRAHKFYLYRRELLLFLHTSPTLHAPPPSTHSHPARSLPHLALGQSLLTPLGYPVSLPPLNRPLQPRLRHATYPFLPPTRRSARSLALQLFPSIHRPAPLPPRCPRLAKKPSLSPPHLPAGCDNLRRHPNGLAHRPQPMPDLREMPGQ